MSEVLTLDQIMAGLSDLARNGEGAQKAQAYRMLLSFRSTATQVPPPLTDEERLDRLVRVFRGAGRRFCKRAWSRAWPSSKVRIDTALPSYTDLTPEEEAQVARVQNLRDFHKLFPELKRSGSPMGYGTNWDREKRALWLRKRATEIFKGRRAEAMERDAAQESGGPPSEDGDTALAGASPEA